MQQARNQQGQPVDWWFIYKTPDHTGTPDNKGFDFLYFDPDGETLVRSPVGLDQDHQALSHTLHRIFSVPESGGFIVYNDEHVNKESNNSDKGHCKGILAFDKASDSALMLLHSTPRFPADKEFDLPADEQIYGQTFLCITLPDYQTANTIAKQMLCQQNPQVLTNNSRIPDSLQENEPLYQLFHGIGIDESTAPSTVAFKSRGGKDFLLIAKSRHWGKDFWLDLVSPELKSDLIVETWRRGKVTPQQDGRSGEFDEDTLNLKFVINSTLTYQWRYQWYYTHDHAKWAVALKNSNNALPWVCVADINRMVSQEKRGGGSLCFQDDKLWQALRDAEEKLHQLAVSQP